MANMTGGQPDNLLAPLGVAAEEERVYRLLLERHGQTAAEIAHAVDASARRAGELLTALESLGLISHTPTRPLRFLPIDPATAVELLILQRREESLRYQEEIERTRPAIDHLVDRFRLGAQRSESRELIEVISGQIAVSRHLTHAMASAESEILGFGKTPVGEPSQQVIDLKVEILRRGVSCRGIYDPDSLHVPGHLRFLEVVGAHGEESRIAPALPVNLLIVDRRVAFTPLQIGEWDEWLLVRSPALIHALTMMFETTWDQAVPYQLPQDLRPRRGGHETVSAEDQRLLALLATGAKEEDIAAGLGVVARTVERRVSRLMDELSVRTRFQLGLIVGERGMLRRAHGMHRPRNRRGT